MFLDNEKQRQFLLGAINATNWPGEIIEEVVKLKIAVSAAPIQPTENSESERG